MCAQVYLRRLSLGPPMEERFSAGKAIRHALPRSCHAVWKPPPNRPDPVALFRHADQHRLKSLLPIRYGRLLESPWSFLRGSANIMANDLADTPVTRLRAWICGDAHLDNFGGFATPERRVIFDLNDFDEALEGPWEWDVKRLAVSIVVAGRCNGLSEAACEYAASSCLQSYRECMRELATKTFLDAWYSRLDAADVVEQFDDQRMIEHATRKAFRRTNTRTLPVLAESVEGRYRLADDPPLTTHNTRSLGNRLPEVWAAYRLSLPVDRRALLDRYQVIDVARKVVGIGSVGLRAFVVLLLGNADDDPLFLQLKEARPSVLEGHVAKSPFENHGMRVVSGQRILQAASDLFLGWTHAGAVNYYVRQLRDMKFGVPTSKLAAADLTTYGGLCGWSLARAHACSGDPAKIGGYLGSGRSFDRAVVAFAFAYADQVERDYEALGAAVAGGKFPVERGI